MPYIVGVKPPIFQSLDTSAGVIQSGILTTTATGISTLVSVESSKFRSVNYQIQAVEGNNFNKTTINVVHDNTNAYLSEFGTINQPIGIATFSVDIDSGKLRLLGFPASSNSTTFKVIFTALET
jgi:hypothetical protein|tara:strand:- start:588 stop:959 length:372 start_codon:yes stop_codon:yes gene_type:complete